MNAMIEANQTLLQMKSGPAIGIAVGCAFGTLFLYSITTMGKDLYTGVSSHFCKYPTIQKITGIALMVLGLFSALVSSAASGFFVAVALDSGKAPFNPIRLAFGITTGLLVGSISVAIVIKSFMENIRELRQGSMISEESRCF